MRVLALDSALGACSAALWLDDAVAVRRYRRQDRGHGDCLLPMITACMAPLDGDFGRLDGFAIGTGPGSFTGLRIGHAVVRGLALGAGKPVAGITGPAIVANAARGGRRRAVTVLLQSGHGRLVYIQSFDRDGIALNAPDAIPPDELRSHIPPETDLLAGDGAGLLRETGIPQAPGPDLPDAAILAAMAGTLDPDQWPSPDDPPAPIFPRPPAITLTAGNVGLRARV